jgi:SAM-dependent methyltransferase
VSATDVERGRAAVVERYGPWTAHNIALPDGTWTMGAPVVGASERNARRILQPVADAVARPLGELRVLDLGALEGLYAIELARQGAEVVAIEGREGNAAKARFAAEALGLERLDVVHADVRSLTRAEHGEFDVVLCLGLLYHLDTPDVFELVRTIASVCRRLAVFETQVALAARETRGWEGREYAGRVYREPPAPWSSIGNPESFWLTRPSLLNLLADAGFTSVAELLSPPVLELAAYRDHVALLALRGEELALRTPPPDALERWPERLRRTAHAAQGGVWAAREWIRARLRGRVPEVFRKG